MTQIPDLIKKIKSLKHEIYGEYGIYYYVPMAESFTVQIPVTVSCSYRKCLFCDLNQGIEFRELTLDEIEANIKKLRFIHELSNKPAKRFLLAGGNPFVLSTEKLLRISDFIHDNFPECEYISCFSRVDDVLRKSQNDLNILRKAGYDRVCLGLESGSDEVLKFQNKGVTRSENISAMNTLDNSEIKYSAYIMLGLGGRNFSDLHVSETIDMLNQSNPFELTVVTLVLFKGAELVKKVRNHEFQSVFCEMYKKGYIYKGFKPVYWCPHDETALAEAEIQYKDDPCTTVFVKFPIHDDLGKLSNVDLSKVYFVIWTTTIWTLPGNLGITLNADYDYVLVEASNGEIYIMAEALMETVMEKGGFTEYKVIDRHPGSFFEHMLADHPFLPKTSLVMLADYVTMDSGTGCVHTAPGFGAEDFQTCRRYNTEMVVPVDDQGRHTEYAGKYAGLTTSESNPIILEDMRKDGSLFATEEILHSYPHCWRCDSEIIFRATPQWFCSVDAFRGDAIDACDEVRWVPEWGKDRMKSMINERMDWCISRQRKWGLPIPVFYCEDCGEPIVTDETRDAVSALFAKEGSNAWYLHEADEILPEGFVCPHCGGKHFSKEEDTLDGWFDSGSTHFAAMQHDQGFWPATVYFEGLDQYRGWFQSSLLTAVGALGKGAPFKECITHGWTVDGEGRAMHKSLGNGMDPAEITNKYGADMLRLWAGSADYHVDVRCSNEIFKQLTQSYLKFRNTARYCLGNLNGFDANNLVAPEDMMELDRWAVTKLNELMEKVAECYNNYEFHVISHAINDFCVVELSSFYLDIIKDRLYCEAPNGLKRRSAQTALYLILDSLTKMFAPILAFTCDEIWLAMPHRDGDDTRNIILNEMNKPFTEYALDADTMAKWDTLISVRDDVNGVLEAARAEKKIGKSLDAQVVLHANDDAAKAAVSAIETLTLNDMFIVSKCLIDADDEGDVTVGNGTRNTGLTIAVSEAKGEKCPRCWAHTEEADPETGLCPRCAKVVAELT